MVPLSWIISAMVSIPASPIRAWGSASTCQAIQRRFRSDSGALYEPFGSPLAMLEQFASTFKAWCATSKGQSSVAKGSPSAFPPIANFFSTFRRDC